MNHPNIYEELIEEPVAKIHIGIGFQHRLCKYYIYMINPPAQYVEIGHYFSADGKWCTFMSFENYDPNGGTYFDLFEKAESCCQQHNLEIVEYYDITTKTMVKK